MTHVKRIETESFMGHREGVSLRFPDTGVVLVTGSNGAGKSTIAEAISVGLWGRTIRGTGWGKMGHRSVVRLWTDSVTVERERNQRGQMRLRWAETGRELRQFESVTRGQPELESIVGDWASWQRASVFSSHDLFTFSKATDGERKRLLESMLGLDVFDTGLSACRAELTAAREACATQNHRATMLVAQIEAETQRLKDASEALGPQPLEVDQAQVAKAERDFRSAQSDFMKATSTKSQAQQAVITLESAFTRATEELKGYTRLKECPACRQALTEEARLNLSANATRSTTETTRSLGLARDRLATAEVDIADLKGEYEGLEKRVMELREAAHKYREWATRAKSQQGRLEEIHTRLQAYDGELKLLREQLDAGKQQVAELEVVDRVLGLRGVRLHVLSRAITGIEQMASVWLGRLLPGVSLRLVTERETKTGKPSDKLDLEVHGLEHDGEYGEYMACSGGERRRVDVALVLALAEVRGAAVGRQPGTLILDEVLDSLDGDGVAAVSEAISTIASERLTIVISHSDALADELRTDMHVHIVKGQATVR